ncbi:MAG: HXXEE domain-containing protein [Paracoccaceae bacterium]
MIKWLEKNWPNTTVFLAIYVTVLLVLFLFESNFALFLIWIQTPVYFLHQFEEYVFPGGFKKFFNTSVLGSDDPDFPMTDAFSMWINVPLIFIAFPVSAILAGQMDISISIWTAYFSIVNALSHLGMFAIHRYNPGFVVSLLVNIPVGLYTVGYFISHDIISLNSHIIGFTIAVSIQAALLVYGFAILKTKITVGQ